MEIVHHLHLWLVKRSVLVKEKVGGLTGDLILKLIKLDILLTILYRSVEFKKHLHGDEKQEADFSLTLGQVCMV